MMGMMLTIREGMEKELDAVETGQSLIDFHFIHVRVHKHPYLKSKHLS